MRLARRCRSLLANLLVHDDSVVTAISSLAAYLPVVLACQPGAEIRPDPIVIIHQQQTEGDPSTYTASRIT